MNKIAKLIIAILIIAIISTLLFFYQSTIGTYESGNSFLLYPLGIMVIFILDFIRMSLGLRVKKAEHFFYIIFPIILFLTGYFLCYVKINVYIGVLLIITSLIYYVYSFEVYWAATDNKTIIFWQKMMFSFMLLFVGYTLCLQKFYYFFGIPISTYGYIFYIVVRKSNDIGTKKIFNLLSKVLPFSLAIFIIIGVFSS